MYLFIRWLVDASIVLCQVGGGGSAIIFCASNLVSLIHNLSNCEHVWFHFFLLLSCIPFFRLLGHCDIVQDFARWAIILCIVPLLIPTMLIRQIARFAICIVIADVCIIGGILFILIRYAICLSCLLLVFNPSLRWLLAPETLIKLPSMGRNLSPRSVVCRISSFLEQLSMRWKAFPLYCPLSLLCEIRADIERYVVPFLSDCVLSSSERWGFLFCCRLL